MNKNFRFNRRIFRDKIYKPFWEKVEKEKKNEYKRIQIYLMNLINLKIILMIKTKIKFLLLRKVSHIIQDYASLSHLYLII